MKCVPGPYFPLTLIAKRCAGDEVAQVMWGNNIFDETTLGFTYWEYQEALRKGEYKSNSEIYTQKICKNVATVKIYFWLLDRHTQNTITWKIV